MDLSYHSLMNDYTVTKKELVETVSDIRRLTGRDPDDFANGSNKFRSTGGRTYTGRKRITNAYSGYERKRFRECEEKESLDKDEYISPEEEESPSSKPSLPSKIVAKHLQVKSRKATIEELNKNDKIKARNRRMFGALMGTLERFEKEEKTRKVKESMRIEIEKKVEEADTREKERLKKEKESLLITRREKEVKLRILEKKIERAESHEVYDSNCKKMANFILTKAKPSIFFLPTSHVSASKKCLEDSKMKINELIKKKKEELISDLNEIEDSYKKDSLSGSKDKENDEAKEAESHDVPETETESLVVEQEDSNPEEEELTNDRLLESSLIDQEFEPIYD